jgi:hypothetical protein
VLLLLIQVAVAVVAYRQTLVVQVAQAVAGQVVRAAVLELLLRLILAAAVEVAVLRFQPLAQAVLAVLGL